MKNTKTPIEKLQAKLAKYVPEGWAANRGTFLDMFNPSRPYPEHVDINRPGYPRGGTLAERGAWRAETSDIARNLAITLKAKGFKARYDGLSVFVNL
jgi:hypothetical protein